MRPQTLGAAPGLLAVALVISSCGHSAGSHSRVPLGPTGSFTTASLACSGISVYPSPGSTTASTATQISFRDVKPSQLSAATVTVVGSVTGPHQGRFVADSDGQGASFYPATPFAAEETVTVSTDRRICGASGDSSTFQIARPAPKVTLPPAKPPAKTGPPALQTFQSVPDLKPPVLTVSKAYASSEGYFLLSPKSGPAPGGSMIVNGKGQLVWFYPLAPGVNSADLRVQTFGGQQVLTWWQGQIDSTGHGSGVDKIMNDHYQVVATVKAGNGYSADLHEFLLGPSKTAWITVDATVGWNLSSIGGPADAAVWDSIVQEIDVPTGNVLFQWSSLDHVGPELSVMKYSAASAPFDYFHGNSIDPSGYGTVLVSARNTDAVYLLSQRTGAVLWTLGGKNSSFRMGSGSEFSLQHDARLRGDSVVTVFDDEDINQMHKQKGPPARALELKLNLAKRTATVVWAYKGPGDVDVANQGSVQLLPDGHVVVGWGAGGYTTEMTTSGTILFQAHFQEPVNSYRAYRMQWVGDPTTAPALAVKSVGSGLKAYVSWNGATRVSSWRLLGGASASSLATLETQSSAGFETALPVSAGTAFVEVEALSARGNVLGRSAVVPTA